MLRRLGQLLLTLPLLCAALAAMALLPTCMPIREQEPTLLEPAEIGRLRWPDGGPLPIGAGLDRGAAAAGSP